MLIHQYVATLIKAIEGTPNEVADIESEITNYLEDKKNFYQEKGLSVDDATTKVLANFGAPDVVGKKIGGTLFPLRKWLLLLLSLFTILHFILTLTYTVVPNGFEGITNSGLPSLIWIGLTLFLIYRNFNYQRNMLLLARKRSYFLLHCLLILVSISYTLPAFIDTASPRLLPFNQLFILTYFLLVIANTIIGPIFKPVHHQFSELSKPVRLILIMLNLISGTVISGYFLLHLLGVLMFGLAGNSLAFILIPFGLLLIWGVAAQLNNYVKQTFGLGVLIQFFVIGYIAYQLYIVYAI